MTVNKPSSPPPPVRHIIIEEFHVGQRIDNFLTSHLKGLPKSRLYRALRSGEVRVNSQRVTADYRLCAGDSVRIPPLRLPVGKTLATPSENLQELLERAVIFENKELIIVNKPSGIASHGGSGIRLGLIEAFRQMRPQTKFLELAHRLDRETTGCIILVKKPSVLKELHRLLKEGHVKKTYLAVVENSWQGKGRLVQAPLLKNQLLSGERIVRVDSTGKPAETWFEPQQVFKRASLLKASPHTGRTHQIRVHAAHLGHAILGDDKYGSKQVRKALRVKHLLLHAASLQFQLSGQTISVKAQWDAEFERVLGVLRGA